MCATGLEHECDMTALCSNYVCDMTVFVQIQLVCDMTVFVNAT